MHKIFSKAAPMVRAIRPTGQLCGLRMGSSKSFVKYDWTDPLDLESQLTDEEKLMRDSARDYCQEKLMPRVTAGFRNENFDRDIMSEMGNWGFLE
ncbi:hypothetical protein DSO57_1036170 [Entomophthora muscae]|uniref:Uncharacterized protein n=1 Tax=Entomophthora muscae TaxID=34485 RepID=A0ACC2RE28_9FUNG|nr:hypothetical protein DSO57_1036170 [Entomophthora muscae]